MSALMTAMESLSEAGVVDGRHQGRAGGSVLMRGIKSAGACTEQNGSRCCDQPDEAQERAQVELCGLSGSRDFGLRPEPCHPPSAASLKRGGLLCAYGYSAKVHGQSRLPAILMRMARVYLWRRLRSWLPGGKRLRIYSINAMRARHPAWFREDLERLFEMLATRAVRPRVAERISFDEVPEAHRRLEVGGLDGKLVLCPDTPSQRDAQPP
jgi:hypothetical protein